MKNLLLNPKKHFLFVIFIFSAFLGITQTKDTTYQKQIVKFTTDSRFLPSSVTSIYQNKNIPSPLDHFGYIVGTPGKLHNTEEVYGYFQTLAEASPNITMEQAGTSEEGRPIYLITISDEASIKNREHYRNTMSRLADPRITSKEEAEKLIADGKLVYFLNGAMHSGETGSPEMLMELVYRLITDPSEETKHILENCIILINPISEPDGRDKHVDWYYRYSKGRTDFRDGFERTAPYWGKYVYHDNNRDGLQISQEITKSIFNIFFDWHPTIMLDLHESVPLLYISTGTGPYNENVDPITIGEWQTIASHEMTTLSEQGLPGAFQWAFYDGWWPGYGIWVANNHNSIGRFYETYGNAGADTYLRDISTSSFAGDKVTSREWYRPDPASGKLWWSLRNNINYMQAGVLASLKYAADNRIQLLKNFYQKSLNSTNFSKNNDTKMFVIPAEQRDPVMAAYLVNQLRRQGIEVHKVKKSESEYVVLLNQPYSRFANDLLTEQQYPAEAKFPPYDAIAWTLGLMYGVDVQKSDSVKYSNDELTLLSTDVSYSGKVDGNGSDYILKYKAQSSVLPTLYAAKKEYPAVSIYILESNSDNKKDTLNAGTIVFKGLTKKQAIELTEKFGLSLVAEKNKIEDLHEIKLPKIAVYHSWTNTQAEGWVRFTFEEKGIPYTSIDKDDLKNGGLRELFDAIIIPDQRGSASSFMNGIDDKYSPMPYTKTEEFPSHGYPDSSKDITGGPGLIGMANLDRFVKDGGVLIPLNGTATIIADAGIGKEARSFSPGNLFHPGSIVTVKTRNSKSPILYGYPETFHIFKGNGNLLRTAKYDRELMVLQYGSLPLTDEKEYEGEIMGQPLEKVSLENPTKKDTLEKKDTKEPKYVLSGMVRNEKEIVGHGAILNVPNGKGNVVFFTFNPLNRYLNHYDSGLLWNTLINWDHL